MKNRVMIETERLKMRVFTLDDLPVYHKTVYGDADVMRYLPGGVPRPIDGTQGVLEWTIQQFETFGFTMWAIFDKLDDTFLGHCGVIQLQRTRDFEIAYAFGTAHWGKGYAAEAAHASFRHAFDVGDLKLIYAMAYPENVKSQRVMQKLGMKPEGRSDRYHGSELVLYSIAREDFVAGDAPYAVIAVPSVSDAAD